MSDAKLKTTKKTATERKKRNQHIRLRATSDMRQRLEDAAAADNRSLSSFVVDAVERRLADVGRPKP